MAQIVVEMAVVPAGSAVAVAVAMVGVMVVATAVDTVAAPITAAQTGSQVPVPVTDAHSKPGQRLQSADLLGIGRLQIVPRSIVPSETVLSGIVRLLAIVVQRFRPVTAVLLGRKPVGPSPVLPVPTAPRRHAPMSFGELAQPDRLLAAGRSEIGQTRIRIGSVPCGHRMS